MLSFVLAAEVGKCMYRRGTGDDSGAILAAGEIFASMVRQERLRCSYGGTPSYEYLMHEK